MNITIEPTPEMFDAPINGVMIPVRIWKGLTSAGTPIEAYVLSITPNDGNADLGAELPAFMRRSRDVYDIGEEARPQ